ALPADAREAPPPANSLWMMMRRRYDAYRDVVVRPFFRDHFSRLDRQIVLVDVLTALNAGPGALHDLELALASILDCFRAGRRGLVSALLWPRAERILFAATKADHLHHSSHDRLEAVLRAMTARAAARAKMAGASVEVIALAAVRATREAMVQRGGEVLPCIMGTPLAGEGAGGEVFDGQRDVAVFPGDLPADPAALLYGGDAAFHGQMTGAGAPDGAGSRADYRFLRFRPPPSDIGTAKSRPLPHIRLDRALEFLIGDRLA
ncbi:MAG: YcjX family protein, partial [Proteobacteria bacterium]|nr:YcjX family protein [Pseudomonadota bacterium]